MGWDYDYGSWWSYVVRRLERRRGRSRSRCGCRTLTAQTKARTGAERFRRRRVDGSPRLEEVRRSLHGPALGLCAARAVHDPLQPGGQQARSSYKGQDAIKRDIANLKAGLEAAGIKEGGWMNSVAPASCSRMANEYYKTEEELMYRLRGSDARGVQGDRRCRPDRAARRSGDRRELGPAEERAERRRLPALYRKCASMCSTTRSAGCPPTRSVSISAGAAGTARTPPTFR